MTQRILEKLGSSLKIIQSFWSFYGIVKFFIYWNQEPPSATNSSQHDKINAQAKKTDLISKKSLQSTESERDLKWYALLQVVPLIGFYGIWKESELLEKIKMSRDKAALTPQPTPPQPNFAVPNLKQEEPQNGVKGDTPEKDSPKRENEEIAAQLQVKKNMQVEKVGKLELITTNDDEQLITTKLNTIQDTLDDSIQLIVLGRWNSRVCSEDFDTIGNELEIYSQQGQKEAKFVTDKKELLKKLNETFDNIKNGCGLWRNLSGELQISIFSICTVEDIGRLSSVSKHMFLIAHIESIWRSFLLKEIPDAKKPENLNWKQLYKKEFEFEYRKYMHGGQIFVTVNDKIHEKNTGKMSIDLDYKSDRVKGIHVKQIIREKLDCKDCKLENMLVIFAGRVIENGVYLKDVIGWKGKEDPKLHVIILLRGQ